MVLLAALAGRTEEAGGRGAVEEVAFFSATTGVLIRIGGSF
jgi:hypothetical protein